MGMPISLLARGTGAHAAGAQAAARALYRQLADVDAMFSPYQPGSEVSRVGRGELTVEQCSPAVREVAARCADARALTGGLFDACRPDGRWDPSGLVKGWAAERAAAGLRAVAGLDWCLNAGGDVVLWCPSGQPFTVGIQDPRDARQVAVTLALRGGAVATSGTAARGSHLYHPRSGLPAGGPWLSVTVTGPSLEQADVLATAAFVAGAAWAELLADRPGYAGLAIDARGTAHRTPDWPDAPAGPR